jgi:hypothetical protein
LTDHFPSAAYPPRLTFLHYQQQTMIARDVAVAVPLASFAIAEQTNSLADLTAIDLEMSLMARYSTAVPLVPVITLLTLLLVVAIEIVVLEVRRQVLQLLLLKQVRCCAAASCFCCEGKICI